MEQTTRRPRMPFALKASLGILAFQVLSNGAMGVLLLYFAAADAEHGRSVPGLQYVLGYGSVAVAIVLIGCAVLLGRRVSGARIVVTVLEVLTVISGLLAVVQGAVQGAVGIVLAVLVIVHLFRADVSDWLRPASAGPVTRTG
ncbi:hypothetical protein B0I33_106100 [Prauserella shujinwangii]|uniref:Uncharacterized protein n=1 Tax=Prauserella shujinwangii TaxID=1453103 RepID=A0A2T0LTH8_9PSEU|nr:hypothetical protein [Prauserella shujinwangii]PRX47003.1 hypothetical protein B0I33_106100 [Prauserella shujinwangii]